MGFALITNMTLQRPLRNSFPWTTSCQSFITFYRTHPSCKTRPRSVRDKLRRQHVVSVASKRQT